MGAAERVVETPWQSNLDGHADRILIVSPQPGGETPWTRAFFGDTRGGRSLSGTRFTLDAEQILEPLHPEGES